MTAEHLSSEKPTEKAEEIPSFDSRKILDVLACSHNPKEWAFFEELRIGTGYGKDSEQRLDAWAIHYFPSKRNVTRCYEVKVSRSDFFAEIKKPLKRRPGLRLANEFYFVAPKGLIKPEEIPPECGLMEIDKYEAIKVTLRAPYRDVLPPTWLFVSSVSRRIDQDRYQALVQKYKRDAIIKMAEIATSFALDRHLEKWRRHNIGSREVPDHIVRALEDLKYEVIEIIKIHASKTDIS